MSDPFLREFDGFVIAVAFTALGLGWAKYRDRRFGLMFASIWGLALLLAAPIRLSQAHHHSLLSSLKDSEIAAIHVGDASIVDPGPLARVVDALGAKEWYSFDRLDVGVWGPKIEFTIAFTNGTKAEFILTGYRSQHAALLEFRPIGSRGGWERGYALIPGLPAVLGKAGVPLPSR